jgi:pimeloyl-ACP methyl ester carboxylesterase
MRRVVMAVPLVPLLWGLCRSSGSAPPLSNGPQRRSDNLVLCPYALEAEGGQKVAAEMGRLLVPENRTRPASRRIELVFLRLKSTAADPGPPIVYLAGGPGESGIDTASGPGFSVFMALREVADVIVLDQRGTGRSQPDMSCSGTWGFPLDRPGDPKQMRRIAAQKVRDCSRELRRQGIDLSGYNTRESADDVEALRAALDVPKVSLWGVSYGTHLALATLRRHERRIHRVILTGVDGPDHAMLQLPSTVQEQLTRVDRLCKPDPRVKALLPDFLGLVKTTLTRLEQAPVTVEMTDPKSRQTVKVAVGKWDFQFYTAHAISATWRLMNLPAQFAPLSRGDLTPVARSMLAYRRGKVPTMMGFMTVCASGASAECRAQIRREARQALLGDAVNFPFPDLCDALGHPDLGASFRAPLRSKVPALFISGTLDGNTPVSHADEVRRGFPNSQHFILEGASHGYDLFYFVPRTREVMLGFLKGRPLSTTRVILSPFPFIIPDPQPVLPAQP